MGALAGLMIYLRLWLQGAFSKPAINQRTPLTRRLHRSLGVTVAITALGFSASGALHLWFKLDSQPGLQQREQQAV